MKQIYQLNTPLQTIMLNVEMLMKKPSCQTEDVQKLLQETLGEVHRLAAMVKAQAESDKDVQVRP